MAIITSGMTARSGPTATAFERSIKSWRSAFEISELHQARNAYLATPAVRTEHLLKILQGMASCAERAADAVQRPLLRNGRPSVVKRAQLFIESQRGEPIRPKAVAAHLHIDQSHLGRLFKQSTGDTLTTYLARTRVANARTLLANPALSITDVAFAVGFGSIARFNAVFKHETGCPPKEYRRRILAREGGREDANLDSDLGETEESWSI